MAWAWVVPLALHDPHGWTPHELAPPVVKKALDFHEITETEVDGLPQESEQHAQILQPRVGTADRATPVMAPWKSVEELNDRLLRPTKCF